MAEDKHEEVAITLMFFLKFPYKFIGILMIYGSAIIL